MTQITTKELSGLSDLLTVETNMVAKCRAYAAHGLQDGDAAGADGTLLGRVEACGA